MKKPFRLLAGAAILSLLLCGCAVQEKPALETEPAVERIAMVVTEQSILALDDEYPALKDADLTGSTCYRAIEAYKARNPQVNVRYTVSLGNREVETDVSALTLQEGEYDYGTLRKNLQFLPQLKEIYFENTQLFAASFHELQNAFPEIRMHYSVTVGGILCDSEGETLDISGVTPVTVLAEKAKLAMLPNLKEIRLNAQDGTSAYTLAQAAELQEQVPSALLVYSFKLFDKDISTTDEEVVYANNNFAYRDGAVDQLKMALPLMRGCKRFVLDSCGFSNELLAELREQVRDTTKLVWRVWFGDEGSCLTDRTVIRHVYGLFDYNCTSLIYCEDAEYLDFGHDEYLKTCEFVSKMKNLKAVIFSGSMISDLSPFANCENLEFLEIAYCGYVNDLSPLVYCNNLKRLNIAYTGVEDLSVLDGINLDVLVTARSRVPAEENQRYLELHPDCILQKNGDAKEDNPYIYPWRYEKDGSANSYYAILQEKFGYPTPQNTKY